MPVMYEYRVTDPRTKERTGEVLQGTRDYVKGLVTGYFLALGDTIEQATATAEAGMGFVDAGVMDDDGMVVSV